MKISRAAAVPIITHDPFFSIWSGADALNDCDLVHWSGARQQIRGYLELDGVPYCFMGDSTGVKKLKQTELRVTAASTEYVFEHEKASLTVRFTSPLLLDRPVLVSRPCTYLTLKLTAKTGVQAKAVVRASADLVRSTPGRLIGGEYKADSFRYARMGRANQHPLDGSGDRVTIDWGFLYLAARENDAALRYDANDERLTAEIPLTDGGERTIVVAYDDLLSIHYFGEWKKAYWTECCGGILDAIGAAFREQDKVTDSCREFDAQLEADAEASGGKDYACLCVMSYRQVIAAHKLISDGGKLVFLSKENGSNGCIATVDVTYPSTPMFFLYGTEYVKAMMRPVFRFARCEAWEYDFAPHDAGRYPYCDGQVYGLNSADGGVGYSEEQGSVLPFIYEFPRGNRVYETRFQMPVEECGNLLILTAAVCLREGSAAFAEENRDLLEKWTKYLLRFGEDPGEQLCTDDFAGHLAHNANLSVKAILGVEALAQIERLSGNECAYSEYHGAAASMAKKWEARARSGDHYVLSFGADDSWSLKYNLIWDTLFHSNLFSDEVRRAELEYYGTRMNACGVPLDSRADYTKSDWEAWCAALAPKGAGREKLLAPIARYLRESPDRVPFSDWYDTKTAAFLHFRGRSVQGGIFMPILRDKDLFAGKNGDAE